VAPYPRIGYPLAIINPWVIHNELTWTDYDLRVEDLSLRNTLILPPEVVVAALA
jgi:hypothetical protein